MMQRLLPILIALFWCTALPAQRGPVIRTRVASPRIRVSRHAVSRNSKIVVGHDSGVVSESPIVVSSGGNNNVSDSDGATGADAVALTAAIASSDTAVSSEVGSGGGPQAISDSDSATGSDNSGVANGSLTPPTAFDGFETGYLTPNINNGPSTAQPNAASGPTLVTSPVHSGIYACKVNAAAGATKCYFGAKHVNTDGGSTTYTQAVPTSYTTFWWQWTTGPTSGDEVLCQINENQSGTAAKFELRFDSTHVLKAYDNTFTLMATGTTVIPSGTWERIDVKCGTSASAGAIAPWEVRINGAVEISGTSANLSIYPMGMTKIGKVVDRHGNAIVEYFDDWCERSDSYADPNQRTGILQIGGDSSPQTWTPVGGSTHYLLISDIPPDGNTTYLQSDLTIGDAEMFTPQTCAAAGISGTPLAVTASFQFTTTGASSTGGIEARMVSGSTTLTTSPALPALTAFAPYNPICVFSQTDPNGNIAWTIANINALKVGVVEGSNSTASRVTSGGVLINYVP